MSIRGCKVCEIYLSGPGERHMPSESEWNQMGRVMQNDRATVHDR